MTRQIHNEKVSCLMVKVGSFVATSRGANQVVLPFFSVARGGCFYNAKVEKWMLCRVFPLFFPASHKSTMLQIVGTWYLQNLECEVIAMLLMEEIHPSWIAGFLNHQQ